MSMLAERKRKQKWTLNPRGNIWSEDTAKFGQKMLEKMGWSNGKGLGAQENGITEHVKISYKNDSKGMGFKETSDQWTEHEDNFSALLQKLGNCPEAVKIDTESSAPSSLEQKSQKSRARVHYHKFTRGKDLSRYSEKDMANIFGRKTLKRAKPEQIVEPKQVENGEHRTFGVETVKGGSMVDYFKTKFNPNFMNTNGFKVGSNGVLKKCDSDDEERPTFNNNGNTFNRYEHFVKSEPKAESMEKKMDYGITFVKKEELVDESLEKNGVEVMKKSKKKSKKDKVIVDEGVSNFGFSEENAMDNLDYCLADEMVETNDVEVSKKSRKKSKKDKEIVDEAVSNSGVCEENYVKLKKKHKRKLEEEAAESPPIKKTKKSKMGIENVCFDDVSPEIPKKKKKSRKSAESDVGLENPIFSDDARSNATQFEVTRSKNKVGLDNPMFSDDARSNTLEYEVTRSKNKVGLNNPMFCDDARSSTMEFEVTRSKNKVGTDNPMFGEANDENTRTCTKAYEVERRKSKVGLENTMFSERNGDEALCNGKVKRRKNKLDNAIEVNGVNAEEYEVKRSKQKVGLDNPMFADGNDVDTRINATEYEVKRSKKKKVGLDNPMFADARTNEEVPRTDVAGVCDDIQCDFVLNTAIVVAPKTSPKAVKTLRRASIKRRKSVRFSEVNEERIIPNNFDNRIASLVDQGMRNELFDINTRVIEAGLAETPEACGFDIKSIDRLKLFTDEGLTNPGFDGRATAADLAQNIDACEAQVENDLNEAKLLQNNADDEVFVGETSAGNVVVENGVRLSFQNVKFGKLPTYQSRNGPDWGPKKSYRHLIKGDIILGFANSNLHQINGYACKPRQE